VLGLKANLLDQILQFSNATKTMLYILVLAALLNVVLNYFFIQRMGYMGAAIATLIAYTFSTILTFIISRKYFRFVIDYKHLLKLLLASAFMYLVLELMPVSKSVWELIIKSGVGFFTFLIVLYFTNQSYILQIVKNFNKQ
jgi:Na+-driven multidrug efflux pump